MKASILHDEHGRILSISKAVDLKGSGSKFTSFGMMPGAGQRLVEVELSAADSKRPLHELHRQSRGYGVAKACEESALTTGEGRNGQWLRSGATTVWPPAHRPGGFLQGRTSPVSCLCFRSCR